MRIEFIRGPGALKTQHKGCVATIGKFDGVHLGHQAVLQRLTQLAKASGLPATVISFEPLPQEVFAANEPPARLTNLVERLQLLEHYGAQRALILPFDQRLSSQSPQSFVNDLLVDQLGIKHLIVGDDFRFGKARAGDFNFLQAAGAKQGFVVEDTPTITLANDRVSSGRVRQALAEQDLACAEQLLGRPYSITGRVAHGDKRGRELGQPTANVLLKRRKAALRGVYAVKVSGAGLQQRAGIANLGVRPTVDGSRESLEVHIFDLPAATDLYGARLTVQFASFIRGEQRFSSLDELAAQIQRDNAKARAWFAAA